MGDYYNHDKKRWEHRKVKIPSQIMCLCWLSECNCQFQRHTKHFVICDDPEIFQKCINKENINYGDEE